MPPGGAILASAAGLELPKRPSSHFTRNRGDINAVLAYVRDAPMALHA